MPIYATANGVQKELTSLPAMVDGVLKEMNSVYSAVDGVMREVFASVKSYDPVFANNSWADIVEACKTGNVPSTWVVGDQKEMKIGIYAYLIDIIGKNHDTLATGGKAPLTFQMHVCYSYTYVMNISASNTVGWESSSIRKTTLPNILKMMPSEVQEGIAEVNKLTSAGNTSNTIVTTADKLFLLSEVEIHGSVTYSKSGEGTQYEYYKAGNSKVKTKSGSANAWWARSPMGESTANFCGVNASGNAAAYGASTSTGVAFAFCFDGAPAQLPDGYTLLDYIQSHGTEHIDLGFKPNQNTRIVFDFENTGDYSANSNQFATLFGARDGTSVNAFSMWMKQTGEVYPQYGSVAYNASSNFSVDLNKRRIYELNKNVATVGDESITCETATFSTSHNLLLFTTNNNGTVETRKAVGKGYSCQVYDGDTLIRNCVPCKNSSGEYGLYDLVYGEFHGNAGTGVFTGSDVELISFTIEGITYQAESGMTWKEWVESEFSPDGFAVDIDGTIFGGGGTVMNPETYVPAAYTDVIENGSTWTVSS